MFNSNRTNAVPIHARTPDPAQAVEVLAVRACAQTAARRGASPEELSELLDMLGLNPEVVRGVDVADCRGLRDSMRLGTGELPRPSWTS